LGSRVGWTEVPDQGGMGHMLDLPPEQAVTSCGLSFLVPCRYHTHTNAYMLTYTRAKPQGTHVPPHAHTVAYVHTRLAHTCACMHRLLHTLSHTCIHSRTCAFGYPYVCIGLHAHTWLHRCTNAHTCTQVCT
jgi:hypothetical protein